MLRAILIGLVAFLTTQTSLSSEAKWTELVGELNQNVRQTFHWRSIEENKTQVLGTLRGESLEEEIAGKEAIADFVYKYCIRHSEERRDTNGSSTKTQDPCLQLRGEVLHAQPELLRLYLERTPCHNCHEFDFYLIFDSGKSSLPVLILNEFWDS